MMLRTSCHQAAGQWEDNVSLILFAYRTTSHRITGFSQFELIFCRAPSDLQNCAEQTQSEGTTPAAYLQSLAARLANYREWVDAQLAQCSADIEPRGPSASRACISRENQSAYGTVRHAINWPHVGWEDGKWIRCYDQ